MNVYGLDKLGLAKRDQEADQIQEASSSQPQDPQNDSLIHLLSTKDDTLFLLVSSLFVYLIQTDLEPNIGTAPSLSQTKAIATNCLKFLESSSLTSQKNPLPLRFVTMQQAVRLIYFCQKRIRKI